MSRDALGGTAERGRGDGDMHQTRGRADGRRSRRAGGIVLLTLAATVVATVSGGRAAAATAVPPIDTSNRAAVVAAYQQYHGTPITTSGWTGNAGTCTAGTLDSAYRDQAYTEMNYFRALAGVPSNITENATYRDQAQAAALIHATNPGLPNPHQPPANSTCYTAAGATGAASSNLYTQFGFTQNSQDTVRGWLDDHGVASMGHRYGLLHPPAQQSGFGDVPYGLPNSAANGGQALYTFDQTFAAWPTMNTPGGALLWPPAGFVPYQNVYTDWSLFLPGADLTNAVVTMTKGGNAVSSPITFRVTRSVGFFPPSTLVWTPDVPLQPYDNVGGMHHATPAGDTTYHVSITGIPGHDPIAYDVTVIDPSAAPPVTTATTGVFRPSNGAMYLKFQNTPGFADVQTVYGTAGDVPVTGDWNNDGIDTIGIYRNGTFFLRNTNTAGPADIVFPFGQSGDLPVAGDWNNDGTDTIGVYRNGVFHLRNANTAGGADLSFALGTPGDLPIAGDWDGDGDDTAGVFRPSDGNIYLKNTNTAGFADVAFIFGTAGDVPVAGDWDGDGDDTIGIYRGANFFLTNTNAAGFASVVFPLGVAGDVPIAGKWQ